MTTMNYDPTHALHTEVFRVMSVEGFVDGDEAYAAGAMIAYAAGDSPNAMPIEWHKEVLESEFIDPNAQTFRAMQAASFAAKAFIGRIR